MLEYASCVFVWWFSVINRDRLSVGVLWHCGVRLSSLSSM